MRASKDSRVRAPADLSYNFTSAGTEVKRRASQCALSSGAHLTCGHRFVADAHIATMAKRHIVRTLSSLPLKRDQTGRRRGMSGEGTKPACGSELT